MRRPVLSLGAVASPDLVAGLGVVVLFVVWAAENGGYDATTWYWGALLVLAALAALFVARGRSRPDTGRPAAVATGCFAAYVAWSYLSIAWASSPGDALEGSNRALLYLLVFVFMLGLRWTPRAAMAVLVTYALAIGVLALVILVRLATTDRVPQLLIGGRLAAPTGYWNGTVALFWVAALLGIVLAARRELPGLLRGLLLATATANLQLTIVGQSRGWLFTFPLMVILVILVVKDRLRVTAAAVLPVAASLLPVHKLLAVYTSGTYKQLDHAASVAGRTALELCFVVLVLGTLLAWADVLLRPRALSPAARRAVGGTLIALAIAGSVAGGFVATSGDPFGFISRQWRGFTNPAEVAGSGSHFSTVGSQRFDVWRVALRAFVNHPIGGLGQDNFGDYYVVHRKTDAEVAWTHSIEMRLLAHTGLIGVLLFLGFLAAAVVGVLAVRRRGGSLVAAVAGAALVPLIAWLVHGSVDWFWELPALSGPVFGFMAMALALGPPRATESPASATALRDPGVDRLRNRRRIVAPFAGFLLVVTATTVLGLPYLAAREVAAASDARGKNPSAALADLRTAADLNPLSAVPGRLGGTIALRSGSYYVAEQMFRQAIDREPGGWYAWFGDGLAASALGDSTRAAKDYRVAASINSQQRALREALQRVNTLHPLSPREGLDMLVLAH